MADHLIGKKKKTSSLNIAVEPGRDRVAYVCWGRWQTGEMVRKVVFYTNNSQSKMFHDIKLFHIY